MKKPILLLIMACALLTGCKHIQQSSNVEGALKPHLGESEFELKPLFSSERFGNIVVSMKGTLIATWGSSYVRARRSEDGGKTWGPEIVIAKPAFLTYLTSCTDTVVNQGLLYSFVYILFEKLFIATVYNISLCGEFNGEVHIGN